MPREPLYWVRVLKPVLKKDGAAHLNDGQLRTRHPGPFLCGKTEEHGNYEYPYWQIGPGSVAAIMKRAAREGLHLCKSCLKKAKALSPEHEFMLQEPEFHLPDLTADKEELDDLGEEEVMGSTEEDRVEWGLPGDEEESDVEYLDTFEADGEDKDELMEEILEELQDEGEEDGDGEDDDDEA